MFCDVDLRCAATQVIRLGYQHGGFDADDVRTKLLPFAMDSAGLIYGSGFETQTWLLEELSQHCRLYGNQPETVRITKDPDRFFSLLALLDIAFPEVSLTVPSSPDGWLSKRIGGSGGTHIGPVPIEAGKARYYQRIIPGQAASLLFLADGNRVLAVGYNLQFVAPLEGMPYRYGGAVSQAPLSEEIRMTMLRAAERITAGLGLRGLNSLDCMVDEENVWVLEVNPRLSATFSLYDANRSGALLLEAHMQASMGCMPEPLPQEPSQAHLIYYAPFDLAVPVAMDWPDWVADVPEPASRIGAGEPLCTVMASAADASQALALAHARIEVLHDLLLIFNGISETQNERE